tara:strand:- start:12 stop:209 length:198 start_codon:yes stop_codon:yes gene_type:complete
MLVELECNMESDSNKWFRDKWNRLDKLKYVEDNWFKLLNNNVEDEILERYNEIEKKYFGKSRKNK